MESYQIEFENFDDLRNMISKQEISDLIEAFHDGGLKKFKIIGSLKSKKWYGCHSFNIFVKKHQIELNVPKMLSEFRTNRMGGNNIPSSPKMAVAMVLVHEIQHANQVERHKFDEKFYKTRIYNKRPCEREARAKVDNNMETIAAIMGQPAPFRMSFDRSVDVTQSVIDEIISTFEDCSEVPLEDIKEELKRFDVDSPKNVELIIAALVDMEIKVS